MRLTTLIIVGCIGYACLLAAQESAANLKHYCDGVENGSWRDYKKIYESDCKPIKE